MDAKTGANINTGKFILGDKETSFPIFDGTIGPSVIDISKLSGDSVKFGATVQLVDEDTDEKVSYRIVGEYEADVKKGKISITSPIARALIGKKKGDSVEVATPKGARAYEILKVGFK